MVTTTQKKKLRKAKRQKHKKQLHSMGPNIVVMKVDNPEYQQEHAGTNGNPKHILAAVNMNESISAHWLHKGKIDQWEYQASTQFRSWYERAGGKGASAIDYTKVKVDSSGSSDPISNSAASSALNLKDIHNLLGPEGFDVVEKLCGQCLPIDAAYITHHERRVRSKQCREMLAFIAVHLGYKQRQRMAVNK